MTTKTYLGHWKHDKSYLIYRAGFLAAGIEPLKIEKYMNDEKIHNETPVDKTEVIKLFFGVGHPAINAAKKLEVEGWERAERYCRSLFRYADDYSDANFKIDPNCISRESVVRWAISYDLKEFPLGSPISQVESIVQPEDTEVTFLNKSLLSIIGTLVILLAEMDETGSRPLETKKITRADGISAKAVSDVINKRFEDSDLPIKRANTAIKAALKLVEKH